MVEELEKRVKRSFGYKIEDFNPLWWGWRNYLQRISDNFTYLLEKPGEKTKCLLGLAGLCIFNGVMLAGCISLDSYLIKLTTELMK